MPAQPMEVAPFARERREALSQAFPGERLVIPAGGLKAKMTVTIDQRHKTYASARRTLDPYSRSRFTSNTLM